MSRERKLGRRLLRYIANHPATPSLLFSAVGVFLTVLFAFPKIREWGEQNLVLILLSVFAVSLGFYFLRAVFLLFYRAIDRILVSGLKATPLTQEELTRFKIQDLVVQSLNKKGFEFHGAKINERATVSDLILIYTRLLYRDWPKEDLISAVVESRSFAFDLKYGRDREHDEKQFGKAQFGDWESIVRSYCEKRDIPIRGNAYTLETGFGTGSAYLEGSLFEELYGLKRGCKYFTDLSPSAIRIAKKRFSLRGRKFFVCSSEDLKNKIGHGSIDLYTSFRTFSSSLFDVRRSIIEAKRVLKPGGYFLVTIPHLYLNLDGTYSIGLMKDVTDMIVTKKYRDEVVQKILGYLDMFEFQSIQNDDSGAFEVIISARKGTAN